MQNTIPSKSTRTQHDYEVISPAIQSKMIAVRAIYSSLHLLMIKTTLFSEGKQNDMATR